MEIVLIIYISLMAVNLFIWHAKMNSIGVQLISMLFIIVLMCGNTEGPDIINYIYVYSHQDEFQFSDIGYQFLENVFYNYLGLTFFQFRFIITIVCFGLIFNALFFYKVNRHLFIFLYMSYLFFIDTIQLRNFIVMAMFTYSFKFLLSDKKKDWIKYIVVNLLATTFQVVSIINLLLLLNKVMNQKRLIKFCILFGSAIFCLSVILKMFGGNIVMLALNMVASDVSRGEGYYVSETHLSGYAILSAVLLGIYICKIHRDKLVTHDNSSLTYRTTNEIFLGNIILLVFASTLLVNINFYRIYRNFLLLLFVDYTLFLDSYKVTSFLRKKYLLAVLFVSALWFIFDIVIINEVQECVNPIFEHNILWEDAA